MNCSIIDNFLEHDEFKKIYNEIMGPMFPWFYNNSVVLRTTPDLEEYTKIAYDLDDYQFVHIMYMDHRIYSPGFDLIAPVLAKLTIRALIRVKANLIPKSHTIKEHGYHTDTLYDSTTAVFYMNTNNGYTRFEDGTIVESVANRIAIFPASMRHTGTTCTDQKTRVAININYF
jgi:hypothetical protein